MASIDEVPPPCRSFSMVRARVSETGTSSAAVKEFLMIINTPSLLVIQIAVSEIVNTPRIDRDVIVDFKISMSPFSCVRLVSVLSVAVFLIEHRRLRYSDESNRLR